MFIRKLSQRWVSQVWHGRLFSKTTWLSPAAFSAPLTASPAKPPPTTTASSTSPRSGMAPPSPWPSR